jgi:hypothetical protein
MAAANGGHGNQYVDQRYMQNYNETGTYRDDRSYGDPRHNFNHASSAYIPFGGTDNRGVQQAYTTPFNPAAKEFQPRSITIPFPNHSYSAVDFSGGPVDMGDGTVWFTDPPALIPAMLPHPEPLPVSVPMTPMFYPSPSQNGVVVDLPPGGYDMSGAPSYTGSHGHNSSISNSSPFWPGTGSATPISYNSNSNSNSNSKKSSTLDVRAAVFNPSQPIKG